ncbi:aggregation-promoting factor C-terminal-like domain-containing protein [Streptomyces reniochalinae]
MGEFHFSQKQFPALEKLWQRESGWRWNADNPTSDAYGIPQALPGRKMRSAGADWRTNPATQIKWGLGYIRSRYGSPSRAWGRWQARNPHWYDNGGYLPEGLSMVYNGTGTGAGHDNAADQRIDGGCCTGPGSVRAGRPVGGRVCRRSGDHGYCSG